MLSKVTELGGLLFDALLLLVIFVYFVADGARFRKRSLALVPAEQRNRALFVEDTVADRAVEALKQAQFPANEIGVEEGGQEAAGLVGTLISMGVPENESRAYDVACSTGRALVTVRSAGRQAEAQVILRRSAALAVDELVPAQTTGS